MPRSREREGFLPAQRQYNPSGQGISMWGCRTAHLGYAISRQAVQAAGSARRKPQIALPGLPNRIGVKDIIDTAHVPTEYGSPIYHGNRPSRDATIIVRLRAAGAVLVGKTVTAELAYYTPGPTRNPRGRRAAAGACLQSSAQRRRPSYALRPALLALRPCPRDGLWSCRPFGWSSRGDREPTQRPR